MTLRETIAHLITSSFIHSRINNATMNPQSLLISSHLISIHSRINNATMNPQSLLISSHLISSIFSLTPSFPYWTYMYIQLSGIPLLELANDRKYKGNPDYLRYKTETPLLFPLPRLFKVHTHHLLLEIS